MQTTTIPHPPQRPTLSGLVIAGGGSSRMGDDKLGLRVGKEYWWQRQARLLRATGAAPVWLSRRPGQDAPVDLACIHDLHTDIGPLAGLHATLARPAGELLAVLAVDMPLVSTQWFQGLLAHCDGSCGALYANGEFLEPLAGVYPACALPVVLAQLKEGRHSLHALARRLAAQGLLRILPLPAALQPQSASFNTPESLRGLRR